MMWTYQTSSKQVEKGPCPNRPACGSSDAYVSYADGHSHCYSCGYHMTSNPLDVYKTGAVGNISQPVQLPQDFARSYIREDAKKWLGQYSLTPIEIDRAGIGWSDRRQSLIFPVKVGSLLALYQSRYFGDDPTEPKWRTIGSKTLLHNIDPFAQDSRLVLVEDIISALKVGRVTNAAPLFGTLIHPTVVAEIVKQFKLVILWLDPDAKMKALKTALTLGEAGVPTKVIFSDYDPKNYITSDIRMLVNQGE